MRFIKLALLSVIILFLIFTIIGLFFPSTVRVSRTIDIHASQDTLHHFLSDIKYWKLWMQGARENTIQFLTLKTHDAGTVAKIGNSEVSIVTSKPGYIFIKWKDTKGKVQYCTFNLADDTIKQTTTVQWWFEQHLNWYPWERYGSILNDKILGPAMEQSLDDLKKIAEEK